MRPTPTLLKDRFDEKVLPVSCGCWLWTGNLLNNTYGRLRGDKAHSYKNLFAHRVAYQLYRGEIPQGKFVCHSCDIQSCVNPEHLWLGTTQENTADRNRKGRQWHPVGELQGAAKLTWEKVKEIRLSKISGGKLAKMYGVSQATISKVLNGNGWIIEDYKRTHIPGNRKLSLEQTTSIRTDKRPQRTIAREFNISQARVSKIQRGM